MTRNRSSRGTLLLCFFTAVILPQGQSNTRTSGQDSARVVRWPSSAGNPMPISQSNTLPLTSGVSQTGSIPPAVQAEICLLGETQYTVQFPGGANGLRIEVRGDADVEVFVRRDQRVTRDGVITAADFFFRSSNGFGSISLPVVGRLLEEAIYFIAIVNCDTTRSANFVLTATNFGPPVDDTVPLARGIALVGSIPGASANGCLLGQTQYTLPAKALISCDGVLVIGVTLVGDKNVDLFIRLNERVVMEKGNVVADRASQSPRGVEHLGFGPSDPDGTFFVAVTNCSTETANYSIGISLITVSEFPFAAVVTDCSLKRDPTGQVYLVVNGHNIEQGAAVTVGGVAPKKLRFKSPEPDRGPFFSSFAKLVARGRVCQGLP
ncbi:MAG: hypothetical protein WAV20_10990, partial [Blastocatellia bacterium]